MYRFFVDKNDVNDDIITISGSDVNHIKNVLRMHQGEQILVSDGEDREYVCEIEQLCSDKVTAKIIDINGVARELPIKVHLYQGLPKGDKMETVIQKMVELGVYRIIPVATKRCVMKLDDKKADKKIARWNAIAESAAKQSKRGIIPKVSGQMNFKEAVTEAKDMDVFMIPYENAENMDYTRNVVNSIKPGDNIAIFIGPEGGFADEEVLFATQNGAKEITLGKRILRTETAGMTLMSVLMYQMEE
ncbi:MAG: 16S rRNA (uracil(1498)-N(3))-methyltransferase [Lachnospiraceae bacterium]|nr:16S rRNA (uracil(1498)-N(3))-methyltransferase [Lachnospiraceae bacterium]